MRVLLLVLVSILSIQVASSQNFPSEYWHTGKVLLLNNDTLNGEVKYNMTTDVVQFQQGERVLTFTSQKVLYFEIFDVTVEYFRRFITLPFNVRPNYKVPRIFELLQEGEISLLCREQIVEQTNANTLYFNPYSTFSTQQLQYTYYFVDRRGKVTEYTMKKRDLLTILRKKEPKVKKFINQNKLKVDRKPDLVRIITYYNSII